jgi:hypothetical protein
MPAYAASGRWIRSVDVVPDASETEFADYVSVWPNSRMPTSRKISRAESGNDRTLAANAKQEICQACSLTASSSQPMLTRGRKPRIRVFISTPNGGDSPLTEHKILKTKRMVRPKKFHPRISDDAYVAAAKRSTTNKAL